MRSRLCGGRRSSSAIAQHLAESIPGADYAEIEGAGHLVGIEQPAALNELLLDFLSA